MKFVHKNNAFVVLTGWNLKKLNSIARSYLRDYQLLKNHDILWIDATHNYNLIKDLDRIMVQLAIPMRSSEGSRIRYAFRHITSKPTLIVFDNATSTNKVLKNMKYLTWFSRMTKIIITSLDDGWDAADWFFTINVDKSISSNEIITKLYDINYEKVLTSDKNSSVIRQILDDLKFP